METSIVAVWRNMPDGDQYNMIKACVVKAAGTEYGTQVLNAYGHDVDEYISEAWIKLSDTLTESNVDSINNQRAADRKQPITLVSMVYRAVRASMSAIVRADRLQQNRDVGELNTELLDSRDNTESVITAVDISRFVAQRDSRDKDIVRLICSGYTERQIGIAIGISGPAVHKRIERMRITLQRESA